MLGHELRAVSQLGGNPAATLTSLFYQPLLEAISAAAWAHWEVDKRGAPAVIAAQPAPQRF